MIKIRLVDDSIYDVLRAEVVGGRLEIDFNDKTAEEVEEIISHQENLTPLELLTASEEKYGDLFNWTKKAGVLSNNGIKTALLTQAIDVTEQRLTNAESNALAAKTMVEELKEEGGGTPENYGAMTILAKMQAQTLEDEQAVKVKSLYDTFDDLVKRKFTAEKQGFKFRDGDTLYKTAQDGVKFEAQYRPGPGTESLYTKIDEAHAGTIEDPIPAAANMEYIYGKYYIEDGTIYICKRGGITDEEAEKMYGEKVTLQYLPSQMVGQYFEVVQE